MRLNHPYRPHTYQHNSSTHVPPSPLRAYNEHCFPSPPPSDTAQEHGSDATPQYLYQASTVSYHPTSSSIFTPSFSFVPSSSFPPSPSSFGPFEAPYSSHPGVFGSLLPSSPLDPPTSHQTHPVPTSSGLSIPPLSLEDIVEASALTDAQQYHDHPGHGPCYESQYPLSMYSPPLSSCSRSPSLPSSESSDPWVSSSSNCPGNYSHLLYAPPSEFTTTISPLHRPTHYQPNDSQIFTHTVTPLQATNASEYHQNSAYTSTVILSQPPQLTSRFTYPPVSGNIYLNPNVPTHPTPQPPFQSYYLPRTPEHPVDAPTETFPHANIEVDLNADDDKVASSSAHASLSLDEPRLAKRTRQSSPGPSRKKAKGKGSRVRCTKPADDDDYVEPSGSVTSTRGRHRPQPSKPPPSAPPVKNSRKRSRSTFASSSGDNNDFGPSSSSTSLHKHHYKGSKLIPGAALVPAPKPNKSLPRTKRNPLPSPVNLKGIIRTEINPRSFLAYNETGSKVMYYACHYSFPDNKTECLEKICSGNFPRHVAIHRRQEAVTFLAALASEKHNIDVMNFVLIVEATRFFITGEEDCSPSSTGHTTDLILGGTDYQPVPMHICNQLKDVMKGRKLNNLSVEDLAVFRSVAIHVAQLYAYVSYSCTCNPDLERGLGGWSRSDRSLDLHFKAPSHELRGVWRAGVPARPFTLPPGTSYNAVL